MKTSQNGLKLIRACEGLCLTVKPDNKGLQIGYGHDLQSGESYPNGITESQAEALLQADLASRYEPVVNRLAPSANQNQFDALVDFCYNLGPGDLATMLHHGFDQAPKQIPAWCWEEVNGVEQKSAGLEERRAMEVALFVSQAL